MVSPSDNFDCWKCQKFSPQTWHQSLEHWPWWLKTLPTWTLSMRLCITPNEISSLLTTHVSTSFDILHMISATETTACTIQPLIRLSKTWGWSKSTLRLVLPLRKTGSSMGSTQVCNWLVDLYVCWLNVVPPGGEATPVSRPVCKETIKSEFLEDDEDWMWKNATKKDDQLCLCSVH
jgi:hypothetical protein